jgi:hypothetical protein
MYLIHITEPKFLTAILKDGKLKSNSQTGKTNQGFGMYKYGMSPYVYFSTTPNLFDKNVTASVTLYMSSDSLFNRKFYTSPTHAPQPNRTSKPTKDKHGFTVPGQQIFPRHHKKYLEVLRALYEHSARALNEQYFYVFQQIAVKSSFNLTKSLGGIQFRRFPPTSFQTRYLQKHYPNAPIVFDPITYNE